MTDGSRSGRRVAEALEAVRSVAGRGAGPGDGRAERTAVAALADAGLLGARRPRGARRRGARPDEVGVLLRETGARAVHLPGLGDAVLRRPDARRRPAPRSSSRRLLPGVATGEALLTPGAPRGRPAGHRRPRHDVRRRHGHRPQDRRHLRRPGGPAAGHRRARRPAGRGAGRPVSDPGVTLLRVRLQRPDHHAHGRPRRRRGRAARRRRRADADRALRSPACASPPPACVAGARDLTADYIKGRTQFGRSLAEFQAVAMQIADVYIASRTLDLAAENAAWRIGQGLDVSRRPRGGGVLGLPRGAAGAAHLPPPARRHGRRRHLPAAPLLLAGSPTSRTRSTSAPRRVPVEDPTTKNLELTAEPAGAQGRAARRTSPASPDRQRAPRRWALRPARRGLPARGPADGRGRLDGRRLAEGVRRPRARRDRADDLRQRGAVRRRAPARRSRCRPSGRR